MTEEHFTCLNHLEGTFHPNVLHSTVVNSRSQTIRLTDREISSFHNFLNNRTPKCSSIAILFRILYQPLTPAMSQSFPIVRDYALYKGLDGKFREVLCSLRYGALDLRTSSRRRLLLPLQRSQCFVDKQNEQVLTVYFESGARSSVTLEFENIVAKDYWFHCISSCANWTISDYYELQEEIGKGMYGVVYRAKSKFTSKNVAIKVMRNKTIPDFRELDVMTSIRHFNILRAIDVLQTCETTYLVLPLMDGDLRNKIMKKFLPDIALIRNVMRQILRGLKELHANLIIHRDLKPENILIKFDEENRCVVKITDFGLSKRLSELDEKVLSGSRYGTPAYSSPEMMARKPYGAKTDLFSAGCILFELLSGRCPRGKNNPAKIIEEPIWEKIWGRNLRLLVKGLLIEEHSRMTANQALASAWFNE